MCPVLCCAVLGGGCVPVSDGVGGLRAKLIAARASLLLLLLLLMSLTLDDLHGILHPSILEPLARCSSATNPTCMPSSPMYAWVDGCSGGEPHTPPHVRHPHAIAMPCLLLILVLVSTYRRLLSSHVHAMAMANNNGRDTPPLSSPSEPAHSTRPAPPSSNYSLSARCTITYTATRPSLVRTRLAAGKDDQFPPIL
ncbi:hypothetical protein J3E72DRAFT_266697 [Bipolaris maydis]|nr:hypothetical protein J3E72DRAFT_266697 [Bipolaris maydis]